VIAACQLSNGGNLPTSGSLLGRPQNSDQLGSAMTAATTKAGVIAATATAAAPTVALTPPAWADPDPHIPSGAANWCPGGDHREQISGGGRYCLGAPFADGTFYAHSWGHSPSPFGPGYWTSSAIYSVWIQGSVQGANSGGCGGGPQSVNTR
jgi:hypothetical protein